MGVGFGGRNRAVYDHPTLSGSMTPSLKGGDQTTPDDAIRRRSGPRIPFRRPTVKLVMPAYLKVAFIRKSP